MFETMTSKGGGVDVDEFPLVVDSSTTTFTLPFTLPLPFTFTFTASFAWLCFVCFVFEALASFASFCFELLDFPLFMPPS